MPTTTKRLRPPTMYLNKGDGTNISKAVVIVYDGRFPQGVYISPEQFIVDLSIFQSSLLGMELLNPHTPEEKMFNKVRYVEFKFHHKMKKLQWIFAINLDDPNVYRTYLRESEYANYAAVFQELNARVANYYNVSKFDVSDKSEVENEW